MQPYELLEGYENEDLLRELQECLTTKRSLEVRISNLRYDLQRRFRRAGKCENCGEQQIRFLQKDGTSYVERVEQLEYVIRMEKKVRKQLELAALMLARAMCEPGKGNPEALVRVAMADARNELNKEKNDH